ncbi:hypothetical protein [Pseudokineococcus lusitanus]|uniref:Phage Mu protein F like protein n=1 Tax=Pseudokineococcus lusitanus TaxID=763993 RepID=A0A3N1HTZ9_9ACTN|nr:hypothetical protein [Pseudokineococcus lusitanus]ROP45939.1 hypothetical protein EDC03_0555 [Pseudokineococcus lusitanus]
MVLPDAVSEHYRTVQRTQLVVATSIASLWARVGEDFDAGWDPVADQAFELVSAGQLAAAASGAGYVAEAMAQQRDGGSVLGRVVPDELAGVAGDGRPLEGLLRAGVIEAKRAVGRGLPAHRALNVGGDRLARAARTAVADAGRAAASAAVAATPDTGWTRMVNPPCCSRCAVQAGRWFRFNQGFQRHPRCDCVHVPTREVAAGDVRTSPRALFDAMTPAEQDHAFTRAGAAAIRDGADIGQVVNARRGASGMATAQRLTTAEREALQGGRSRGQLQRVDVFGRRLAITTEGTTRRGVAYSSLARRGGRGSDVRADGARYFSARAPRLMPEGIYEVATSREDAVRLLRANGYLR